MKNILIVEPDKVLADIYKKILQKYKYKVKWAKSAQSAINNADKLIPDLIILELQLVEHSGIEFLYELRSYKEWQHIPVIINTYVPPNEFINNWQILRDELFISKYLYKPQASTNDIIMAVNRELALSIEAN